MPPLHVFGGRPLLDAALPTSRITDRPFHLLLDLDVHDPRLASLGITSVDRLALLANLRLDASTVPTFVRHHARGRSFEVLSEPEADAGDEQPDELPQLPVELEPLSEAEAGISSLDELPDDVIPWHQVGGQPRWPDERSVAAPRCPVTDAPMRFIAQIDSMRRFPLATGDMALLFGDCGSLYAFWSDRASISATFSAW